MSMYKIFKKYLDDSPDCDTIALELSDSYNFEQCYETMYDVDMEEADIITKKIKYPCTVESSRGILFDLIREIWDAAYNYGYQNAQADEGVILVNQD